MVRIKNFCKYYWAINMQSLILFLCLLPFLNSFSQQILLSKDSLSLDDQHYMDSLTIYNEGNAVLKINPIYCENMNYGLNTVSSDSINLWKPLYEFDKSGDTIKIQPNDSLRIWLGIWAILTKQSSIEYNQIDTMYFYNNSTNMPIQSIEISNKIYIGDVKDKENTPTNYNLFQNYPNPFNPNTKIVFSLNRPSIVFLKIYDINGKEIKILEHGYKSNGSYEYIFDGSKLSSGIYYYQLAVGQSRKTKKMLLLK
jgi:hypothetical protein